MIININAHAFLQTLEYSFLRSHSCQQWERILTQCLKYAIFVSQHGQTREKSEMGHESDKLIESYSASTSMTTVEKQFEPSSIVK